MTVPAARAPLWSWLHVSDIHFLHGAAHWQRDQELVLEAMLADVRERVSAGDVPRPDAVLITGDIGFSGAAVHPEEYDLAGEFVRRLSEACGAPAAYCVPGNHDVARTRPAQREAWRLLGELRGAGGDTDASLSYPADAALLDERLAAYARFAETACAPVVRGPAGSWHAELPAVDGTTVRLVGLNTALLCNGDDDERALRTGKWQLSANLRPHYADEVVLTLAHHPFGWLHPQDASAADAWVGRHSDVLLYGHVHAPAATLNIGSGGKGLVLLQAGAAHADRDAEGQQTAHAYSFGALVLDPDGRRAVRIWPRTFAQQQARFVLDAANVPEGQTWAQHALTDQGAPPPRPADAGLARLSAALLARIGQRRTGYPTDSSVAELNDGGLVVAPGLRSSAGNAVALAEIADKAVAGSVLVLGAPGSGKTVMAYGAALAIRAGGRATPVPIDLRDLPPGGNGRAAVLAAASASVQQPPPDDDGRPVCWTVDGLDEALASGADPTAVAQALTALAATGGLLVTCRRADYERVLMRAVGTGLFATVAEVQPWTTDGEFAGFLRLLADRGQPADPGLLDRVRAQPSLAALVTRPLHARMLVMAAGAADIRTPADLYQQYFGRLAAATETALRQAGCDDAGPVGPRWRDTAWRVFVCRQPADAFPVPDALEGLALAGLTGPCGYRVLAAVADLEQRFDELVAGFVHYSFFEYFVARRVADGLLSAWPQDPAAARSLLAADLPQEMRRFAVQILRARATDLPSWPAWLAQAWAPADTAHRRTPNNLLAYVACRLGVPAADPLRRLLDAETDPFLRNSLGWALARCDDRDSVAEYLSRLDDDLEMSSLNRGYLLYYFGDLPRTEPPYPDPPPHRPWPLTRAKLAAKLADPAHAAVPASREAVDLYTWFDLLRVRAERLDDDEAAAAAAGMKRLHAAGLPAGALDAVERAYVAADGR